MYKNRANGSSRVHSTNRRPLIRREATAFPVNFATPSATAPTCGDISESVAEQIRAFVERTRTTRPDTEAGRNVRNRRNRHDVPPTE